MIHSLNLIAFGRFRHAEFALSPVTVVFGPNEAGKTTFFDGLFQALCNPSEAKKPGKLLKARYGSQRQATAVLSEGQPVSDEEFLQLYAVRAGDLEFQLEQGTDWMEKLKSRLFHGGLDPAALTLEFSKRASDTRNLVHNRELQAARDAAAKARIELDGHRRERDSHLSREREVAGMEASLAALREAIRVGREEVMRLTADLEAEEGIARRQKLSGQLARLEEWSNLEAECRALDAMGEDLGAEYQELTRATRSRVDSLLEERGKRDLAASQLAESRLEARDLRAAAENAQPRSELAANLALRARGLEAAGISARIPAWAWSFSLLVFGVGAGSAFWLRNGLGHAGLAAGILAAVAVLAQGKRMRTRSIQRARENLLGECKDAWLAIAPAADGIADIGTLMGFALAMDGRAREKDEAALRARDAAKRAEARAEDLEKSEAILTHLKEAEEAARRLERAWLQAHGVEGFAEYERRMQRAAQVRKEVLRRRAEIEFISGGREAEAWRSELRRQLRDLDAAGVPESGRDEAACQRIRNRKTELERGLEEKVRQESDLIDRKAGAAGEIRGALGKLAGEIVSAEDRLALAEAEIARREADKRAAAVAHGLFKEIGDGADLLLAGLSREIGGMLANILPGERPVALSGLDSGRIQVSDAGGESRALPNLSTGTQHSLVLAAKLALARKHREGPGLLVFDEPFLAMDDDRETRALELLRDFHLRHGWQIILLTKEPRLKDKMIARFRNPLILDLTPVG